MDSLVEHKLKFAPRTIATRQNSGDAAVQRVYDNGRKSH